MELSIIQELAEEFGIEIDAIEKASFNKSNDKHYKIISDLKLIYDPYMQNLDKEKYKKIDVFIIESQNKIIFCNNDRDVLCINSYFYQGKSDFKIIFYKCKFYNNKLSNEKFTTNPLNFIKCDFDGDLNFCVSECEIKLYFKDCDFHEHSIKFDKKENIRKNIVFKEFTFLNNRNLTICGDFYYDKIVCKVLLFGATDSYLNLDKIDFKKATFHGSIKFENIEIDKLYFDDISDIGKLEISNANIKLFHAKNTKFGDEIVFSNVKIDDLDFSNSTFEKIAKFRSDFVNIAERNIFNKANFAGVYFKDEVYFDNSKFSSFVDFSEAKFDKYASFYGTEFDSLVNFSFISIKDKLNLVNSKLNLDFYKLKIAILNQANTIYSDYKAVAKVANDMRNSFRFLKNHLIGENNLLDASKYRVAELYCKEIELDNKKSKNNTITQKQQNFRDYVDRFILQFYRKTSDHHTDFLRILNNLVALIVFAILFIINLNLDYKNHDTQQLFAISVIAFVFFCFIIFFNIRTFDVDGKIIKILYIIRFLYIFTLYILAIILFIIAPKYIIPTIGIFADKRDLFDPLSAVGAVYSVAFAVFFYSFIKTARKNSIIPN